MIRAWENSWDEFVPFLEFPAELRRVVYTTNAVESLNARFRKAVRHRGHFPEGACAASGFARMGALGTGRSDMGKPELSHRAWIMVIGDSRSTSQRRSCCALHSPK